MSSINIGADLKTAVEAGFITRAEAWEAHDLRVQLNRTEKAAAKAWTLLASRAEPCQRLQEIEYKAAIKSDQRPFVTGGSDPDFEIHDDPVEDNGPNSTQAVQG